MNADWLCTVEYSEALASSFRGSACVCAFLCFFSFNVSACLSGLFLYCLSVWLVLSARQNIHLIVCVRLSPPASVCLGINSRMCMRVDSNERFGVCYRWRVYHYSNPFGRDILLPNPPTQIRLCAQVGRLKVLFEIDSLFNWLTLFHWEVIFHLLYLRIVFLIIVDPSWLCVC